MAIELTPYSAAPDDAKHRAQRWSVLTPPATMPVTSAMLATQARFTLADQDADYIALLIAAATEYAETRLNAALIEQTIAATFYDGESLTLPRGPLIEITSVTMNDTATTAYEIAHAGNNAIVVPTAGSSYPVSITYKAGYGSDAADVPSDIRMAILAHAASLFAMRETITPGAILPVPHSLEDFYRAKRRTVGIG